MVQAGPRPSALGQTLGKVDDPLETGHHRVAWVGGRSNRRARRGPTSPVTLTQTSLEKGVVRMGNDESYVQCAEGWAGLIEAPSRGRSEMTACVAVLVETIVV